MPQKTSLQRITDSYIKKGYKGERLRWVLLKDKRYAQELKRRQRKLSNKIKITHHERKKYVLSTDEDFAILKLSKQLDMVKLTKADKALVKLIKTQLELDWRGPLIKELRRLLRRYSNK